MNSKSDFLQIEYKNRFLDDVSYRDHVWRVLCDDYFSSIISNEDTVLDLGAGWGEFSRNIKAKKKYSMDLNPDCGERIGSESVFLKQDCSDRWPLEDNSLDVVFTSNFLEHLPNKEHVEKTLDEAFRCLKQGGKIVCLGPNIKYVNGMYWDFWDHFVPITEESLAELLILKGFIVNRKIARFLPYSMSGGFKPPVLFVAIYLKLPFIWRFFGKQFLVIAEKKK